MNTTFTKKEIDDLITIFNNSSELQHLYFVYNIFLTSQEETEIILLFLNNSEIINNNTITELYNYSEVPFLYKDLEILYKLSPFPKDLYKQLFYVYKYGTIKRFFQDNWSNFLPDIDILYLKDGGKKELFQKAFMIEFDRFSDIIDRIYNILDVDEVPNEYLNYLAQLIGYEREEDVILTDIAFRELLKNIIEVYRIKGTNFSFELFFNFLGFEVTLKEFWFDKRFYYGIGTNPETGQINKNKADFYLTSKKPTDYIPVGMQDPFIINENNITETLDMNKFNKMIENGDYTARQLLGIDPGYPNTPYTYFKTNVMEYKLTAINTSENSSLTSEQNKIIKNYSDFLTPIFIENNIIVIIPPFEDNGDILVPKDTHTIYSINYLNNRPDDPSTLDTEKRFYSRNDADASFYAAVRDYYNIVPAGEDEQYYENYILEKVSELMDGCSEDFWNNIIPTFYGTGNTFPNDKPLRRREILFPLMDLLTNTTTSIYKNKINTSPISFGANFSFIKGDIRRLSEATGINNFPKVAVKSIDVPNGIITTDDSDNIYYNLSVDTYIKLIGLLDRRQDGKYKIKSIEKNGSDTVFYIDLIDTPILYSSQTTVGGFLQLYYDDWTFGNYHFPFLFDRVVLE